MYYLNLEDVLKKYGLLIEKTLNEFMKSIITSISLILKDADQLYKLIEEKLKRLPLKTEEYITIKKYTMTSECENDIT